MKKLLLIVLTTLTLSVVCVSCGVKQKFRVPGFVSEYKILESDVRAVEYGIKNGELSLNLLAWGDTYNTYDYYSYGKETEYYRFCQKFNDLYYNQKVYELDCHIHDNNVKVVADIITDIQIVSDDDWNGEYAAGTPLNGLFSLKYYTVYPYIASRYKAEDKITTVEMPLSEVANSNIKMMMYDSFYSRWLPDDWVGVCLKFYTDCLPANPIQTLHITLTTDEGKNIEYTVELDLK